MFALGQMLVESRSEFVCFTKGDLANPGAFVWTPPLALMPVKPLYEGKIVILVDEVTLSSAEYTTMALRTAPGAMVVGSTTAGADGNASSDKDETTAGTDTTPITTEESSAAAAESDEPQKLDFRDDGASVRFSVPETGLYAMLVISH